MTFLPVENSLDGDGLAVEGGDDAGVLGAVLDPSPSVSRSVGSLADSTSSASLRPSLSVSADFGFVPSLNSLKFLSPSLSESLVFQEPVRWYLAAKAWPSASPPRGRAGADEGQKRCESDGWLKVRRLRMLSVIDRGRGEELKSISAAMAG